MKKFSVGNAISYLATGSIVVAALVFTFISLIPIDVLNNWNLTTDKPEYEVGSTLIVTTKFDKLRNVTGTSKRYIECKTRNGSTNRIAIGEKEADRTPQKRASNEIYLGIPRDTIEPPTTCFVEIVVTYNIYSFRNHTETARTPEFKVIEQPEKQSTLPEVTTPDNDNEVVENAPVNRSKDTARSVPVPETFAPGVEETSPVEPPNNAIVCQVPPITFLYNLLVGGC